MDRNRGSSIRSQRSPSRDRRSQIQKPIGMRMRDCFRSTVAFVFSNVGVCGLMVGYTIMGAFIFKFIEGRHYKDKYYNLDGCYSNITESLWNITVLSNAFQEGTWRNNVADEVIVFQECMITMLHNGWDGNSTISMSKWSFEGGFLYSLTVITTIGYGHITPLTNIGKIVTIMYTIFGMPVFLLYMANMGDILAKTLKWIYSKICICRRTTPQYDPSLVWRSADAILRGPVGVDYFSPDRREDRRGGIYDLDSCDDAFEMEELPPMSRSALREIRNVEDEFDPSDPEFEYSPGQRSVSYSNESWTDDKTDFSSVNIPIKVSLIIMISLLYGGTHLFRSEGWDMLTNFYFCFISLTTIGFGDYVPGSSLGGLGKQDENGFIYCSLYLMLGLAILSMCFNLMQEKLVNKVNSVMKALAISNEKEPD